MCVFDAQQQWLLTTDGIQQIGCRRDHASERHLGVLRRSGKLAGGHFSAATETANERERLRRGAERAGEVEQPRRQVAKHRQWATLIVWLEATEPSRVIFGARPARANVFSTSALTFWTN